MWFTIYCITCKKITFLKSSGFSNPHLIRKETFSLRNVIPFWEIWWCCIILLKACMRTVSVSSMNNVPKTLRSCIILLKVCMRAAGIACDWLILKRKEIGRGVQGPLKFRELRRFSSIKYPKTPLRCPENLQLTLIDFTKIYKF